jgi:magnesium-transporting ATPase (P-type)
MYTSWNYTHMITGDHKLTAKAIAKQLGIITSEEDLILSGTKLAELSEKSFGYSGTCSCLCPCEPRAKIKNYKGYKQKINL